MLPPRSILPALTMLDLLRQLYGELLISEAVWGEVVIEGEGQPGAEKVRTASWIRKSKVENQDIVRVLRQDLDAGEAEAIALALEKKVDLLLMDGRLGRETAKYLGLQYIGLIGVLIGAKRTGIIGSIKPCLAALRDIAGFRVSDALYTRVLQDEGEA